MDIAPVISWNTKTAKEPQVRAPKGKGQISIKARSSKMNALTKYQLCAIVIHFRQSSEKAKIGYIYQSDRYRGMCSR